ncbi:MAG: hypothetical protein GOV02_04405 [Candidatus Aenigmarchaeota archaeon]|nr:hypothetical protein [Candidatus Aenigmarchaeota archaeon]
MKYIKILILFSIIGIVFISGCVKEEIIQDDEEIECPIELINNEYTHDSRYGAYVLRGYHESNGNVVTCTTDGNYLYCKSFVYDDAFVDIVLKTENQEEIPERPDMFNKQTFVVENIVCEKYIRPTVITTTISNQCSPGECYSNGFCCPSTHRYYCEGSCYGSQSEAMSASQGRCSSNKVIC